MSANIKVIFSGGGTGGHIYPAIAIAKALQKKCHALDVLFVGALGKMEMEKVPSEGFQIVGIPIAGVQRSFSVSNILKNLILPFKLTYSLIKTFGIIQNFKPDIVVGTGGYASGPTLKMASWLGIPTVIQEQNSLPGYTNRILAGKAEAVFVSFDHMEGYFSNKNVINAGNAIRESFKDELIDRDTALKIFGLDGSKKTVFVTGGSLGAKVINEAIAAHFDSIQNQNIQLIWQCGKTYLNQYKSFESSTCKTFDFIKDIQAAYSAADIIVTRAGGAIFEMFVVGKPIIVLPSPNVAEDHQTKNALALEEKHAAIMIKDVDAKEKLVPAIVELLGNDEKMEEMQKNISKLAKPYAASEIADKIIEVVNNKRR